VDEPEGIHATDRDAVDVDGHVVVGHAADLDGAGGRAGGGVDGTRDRNERQYGREEKTPQHRGMPSFHPAHGCHNLAHLDRSHHSRISRQPQSPNGFMPSMARLIDRKTRISSSQFYLFIVFRIRFQKPFF
jgi:hypothetical protein